jgi:hypothetical protein
MAVKRRNIEVDATMRVRLSGSRKYMIYFNPAAADSSHAPTIVEINPADNPNAAFRRVTFS